MVSWQRLLLTIAGALVLYPQPARAGWWESPAFGNARGAATGNSGIINSPYYNPNLPAGGVDSFGYPSYRVSPGANPYYGYAPFGAPMPIGGGCFSIASGGRTLNFWRSPRGYYYPWGFAYAYPVILYQSGSGLVPTQPPVSAMLRDMQDYLDEAKSKGRLSEDEYRHFNLWLRDLVRESADVGEGRESEEDLRKQVDDLGRQIAYDIKPIP